MKYVEAKEKWDTLWANWTTDFSKWQNLSFQGLGGTVPRQLLWMSFLGVFPNADKKTWITTIVANREQYIEMLAQECVNPGEKEEDPNKNNPLSLDQDSPWPQYFRDHDLRNTILQDVTRTFPEEPFFQNRYIQHIMVNILFLYCKLNHDISYRQGMHELLAPFVYSVFNLSLDKEEAALCEDPDMKLLLDREYVEHDSFFLFRKLMNSMKKLYEYSDKPISSFKRHTWSEPEERKNTPLLDKCHQVFDVKLNMVDPTLHRHIKSLHIEPQLFLLKWIRLLFSREFTFSNVLILWDGIFADDWSLTSIDYVCIVMLQYIRDEVIENKDFGSCLHLLMKFKFPNLQSEGDRIPLIIERFRMLKLNFTKLHYEEFIKDDCRRRKKILTSVGTEYGGHTAASPLRAQSYNKELLKGMRRTGSNVLAAKALPIISDIAGNLPEYVKGLIPFGEDPGSVQSNSESYDEIAARYAAAARQAQNRTRRGTNRSTASNSEAGEKFDQYLYIIREEMKKCIIPADSMEKIQHAIESLIKIKEVHFGQSMIDVKSPIERPSLADISTDLNQEQFQDSKEYVAIIEEEGGSSSQIKCDDGSTSKSSSHHEEAIKVSIPEKETSKQVEIPAALIINKEEKETLEEKKARIVPKWWLSEEQYQNDIGHSDKWSAFQPSVRKSAIEKDSKTIRHIQPKKKEERKLDDRSDPLCRAET